MATAAIRLRWMELLQRTGNAAEVCAAFGISRPTLRKWSRRFEERGPAGLQEPTRAPASSPNRKVFAAEEALILSLRREKRLGVHRLRSELRHGHGLELSADTILKVLRRAGEPSLGRPPPADPSVDAVAEPVPSQDGLAGAIAELITTGALRPGEKLSEAVLGARLGVGRTLVREALKQLAVHGLVVLQRNRGAFVARPSLAEVEQAYAARRLLEGAIVEDVAQHCTAHDIRTLRKHLAQQEAAHAAGQLRSLIKLLTEFHLVVAGLGENRILAGMLADLAAKTSLAVMIYDHGGHHACALEEHGQLINLLAAGEGERARKLMQHHLTTNEARLHDGAVGE